MTRLRALLASMARYFVGLFDIDEDAEKYKRLMRHYDDVEY